MVLRAQIVLTRNAWGACAPAGDELLAHGLLHQVLQIHTTLKGRERKPRGEQLDTLIGPGLNLASGMGRP